jgi:hypothetical protein
MKKNASDLRHWRLTTEKEFWKVSRVSRERERKSEKKKSEKMKKTIWVMMMVIILIAPISRCWRVKRHCRIFGINFSYTIYFISFFFFSCSRLTLFWSPILAALTKKMICESRVLRWVNDSVLRMRLLLLYCLSDLQSDFICMVGQWSLLEEMFWPFDWFWWVIRCYSELFLFDSTIGVFFSNSTDAINCFLFLALIETGKTLISIRHT